MTALNGQCLCGQVKFIATPVKHEMGTCHCSICRRWSGGMSFNTDCGDSLKFNDESTLGIYHSSDYGERLFCKNCGSNLAWRSKDKKMNMVSIQTFDNPEQFNFAFQIYIDNKPKNYALANETVKLTEQQFLQSLADKG